MDNKKNSPAISIIMPMYNTEKYIRQSLISILSQKFQDYEVIIIDDGSTDNSVTEVEKLIPAFDGRINFVKRTENSGCPGIPRNEGIKLARGEYIAFVDTDDMLMPGALQDLYDITQETKADVIHTERFYFFNDDGSGVFDAKKLVLGSNEIARNNFVEKNSFVTKDMAKRITQHCQENFYWSPWGRCFRREFLLENKITFPHMAYYEDLIFCFKALCLAKTYVRVPNVINIIRVRQNSASKNYGDTNSQRVFHNWVSVVLTGMNEIDEFMQKVHFFSKKPEYRYMELNFFMKLCVKSAYNMLKNNQNYELELFLHDDLSKRSVNNPALISYLVANMI